MAIGDLHLDRIYKSTGAIAACAAIVGCLFLIHDRLKGKSASEAVKPTPSYVQAKNPVASFNWHFPPETEMLNQKEILDKCTPPSPLIIEELRVTPLPEGYRVQLRLGNRTGDV